MGSQRVEQDWTTNTLLILENIYLILTPVNALSFSLKKLWVSTEHSDLTVPCKSEVRWALPGSSSLGSYKAKMKVLASLAFYLRLWRSIYLAACSGFWQNAIPCSHRPRSQLPSWLIPRSLPSVPKSTWIPHHLPSLHPQTSNNLSNPAALNLTSATSLLLHKGSIQIIQDNLPLITSAKSLLSCKVIHSQVPGIRVWKFFKSHFAFPPSSLI